MTKTTNASELQFEIQMFLDEMSEREQWDTVAHIRSLAACYIGLADSLAEKRSEFLYKLAHLLESEI